MSQEPGYYYISDPVERDGVPGRYVAYRRPEPALRVTPVTETYLYIDEDGDRLSVEHTLNTDQDPEVYVSITPEGGAPGATVKLTKSALLALGEHLIDQGEDL